MNVIRISAGRNPPSDLHAIIEIPVDDLHPFYTGISSYLHLPEIMREQIAPSA